MIEIKEDSVIGVIGVCGINGNLIARILSDHNYEVLANDIQSKEKCRFKKALEDYPDIQIIHGDLPEDFLDKIDYIVLPAAMIESENELYIKAIENDVKMLTVGDILEIFEPSHPVICVTGTNGKTTTTSLLKQIAYQNNIVPVEHGLEKMQGNNGDIPQLQSRLVADVSILETGTFGQKGSLKRTVQECLPDVGIITNITPDHLINSNDFLNYAKVKGEIIPSLENGTLIINNDDPMIKALVEEHDYQGNLITFGLDYPITNKATKECLCGHDVKMDEIISGCGKYACDCGISYSRPDYLAHKINDAHDSFILKTPAGNEYEFNLSINGLHNIYNAVGVIVIAHEIFGLSFEQIAKTLSSFEGVSGRMESIGTINDVEVMVDYAHNPAGIKTILKELKNHYSKVVNVLTVSSESGIEADMEILECSLEYADYVVPASHNTYICAQKLLDEGKYLEKIILPGNMPEGDKKGTLGANKEQVIAGFSKASEIDVDLIVCTGEAAFKYKDELL